MILFFLLLSQSLQTPIPIERYSSWSMNLSPDLMEISFKYDVQISKSDILMKKFKQQLQILTSDIQQSFEIQKVDFKQPEIFELQNLESVQVSVQGFIQVKDQKIASNILKFLFDYDDLLIHSIIPIISQNLKDSSIGQLLLQSTRKTYDETILAVSKLGLKLNKFIIDEGIKLKQKSGINKNDKQIRLFTIVKFDAIPINGSINLEIDLNHPRPPKKELQIESINN